MTSRQHEDLVAWIIQAGMGTPEVFPDLATMDAQRLAEGQATWTVPDGVSVTDVDAGGVPAVWVTPTDLRSAATLVYLHGGGYIWMNPHTYLPVMGAIARAAGARCLGLHYRRAPEHRFPAAVDDAVSAYRWLLEQAVDPGHLVLVGDSAGGGLVLSTLVALKARGVTLPAAAACISPWTDLCVTGPSADTAADPVVSGVALRMMAGVYLGEADPRDPTASPLYADLRGFPPLQVQVGSRESLLDDARRFAQRATDAGVDVILVEYPGAVHMWTLFGPDIPESKQAFALIGDFIRTNTGT